MTFVISLLYFFSTKIKKKDKLIDIKILFDNTSKIIMKNL